MILPERFRYPQECRLRQRADFSLCYDEGFRYHTPNFIFFIRRRDNCQAMSRIGMTVSRKVGKAVTRNRLKRLLREFFRQRLSLIPPNCDIVIVAKKNAASLAGLAKVRGELLPVFRRVTGIN